jgi:alkyl sulfatase BDS1-like metallo-beta-lactamase superfamily hydrolase
MEAFDGEAVIGGNAKARRGQYQFGISLPVGERGNIDEGIGKNDSREGEELGSGLG